MKQGNLSDRKKKILQALVDTYIADVEPISSSAIQSRYLPDVSTATIRSELATLEELGYLTQPHISSGRIPSSKAYRYYVDNFVTESDLDMQKIKEIVNSRFETVEEIVKDGAKIVSDVTNYTSMMMISNADNILIKNVKITDLYDGNALVLIITDTGVVKDKEIKLPVSDESNFIEVANGLLNKCFSGKKLAEVINNEQIIDNELENFRQLYQDVIELLQEYKNNREGQLFVEGQEKIFNYPEYQDLGNVKNFMSVITHKEKIREIMQDQGDIQFSIRIGSEENEDLQNMALVSAKYLINGKEVGQLGVLGPERMDYKKVISVLKQLGKLIGELEDDKNK